MGGKVEGYLRYGLYWCPQAGSALAEAGAGWLGWDLYNRCSVASHRDALTNRALTARARRYGFHGTLKAPFRLAEGRDRGALEAAVAAFAARTAPVVLGPLTLDAALGFAALRPAGEAAALAALAAAAVRDLDPFRAPMTEEERATRIGAGLDPGALARLDRWGYPHVMEAFRFHLTLSRPLERQEIDPVLGAAKAHFGPHMGDPVTIRSVALVGDPGSGAGFHHLSTHALSG